MPSLWDAFVFDLSFFKHVGILASIQMGLKEKASVWRDALPLVPPNSADVLDSSIAHFLDLVMLIYNVFFNDALTIWDIVWLVLMTCELILLCSSMGKRTIIWVVWGLGFGCVWLLMCLGCQDWVIQRLVFQLFGCWMWFVLGFQKFYSKVIPAHIGLIAGVIWARHLKWCAQSLVRFHPGQLIGFHSWSWKVFAKSNHCIGFVWCHCVSIWLLISKVYHLDWVIGFLVSIWMIQGDA